MQLWVANVGRMIISLLFTFVVILGVFVLINIPIFLIFGDFLPSIFFFMAFLFAWISGFWGNWLVEVAHSFSDHALVARFISSGEDYVQAMSSRLKTKNIFYDHMDGDWYVFSSRGIPGLRVQVRMKVSGEGAQLLLPFGLRKLLPEYSDKKLTATSS